MAVQLVTPITKAGVLDLSAALVAADVAGDSVPSASGIFIAIENGDASPHTVTVSAPAASASCGRYGSVAIEDMTIIVPAGATAVFAIPLGYVSSTGDFVWTYDAVTSVAAGVFSISA